MSLSWINPNIFLRETPKCGYGYYASWAIAQNDIVIVQGGKIVTDADLGAGRSDEKYAWHAFQVERDLYICPLSTERVGETGGGGIFCVNHSCAPNCGFRGQITLVAMRDIAPNEEITYDYAMTDWGVRELGWIEMKCLCGSIACRGNVGFKDWEKPEIQTKYAGYFSRYIQDMIDETRRKLPIGN